MPNPEITATLANSHIKDLSSPGNDRVLIYAGDGGCYWREGGHGYCYAHEAGAFTREEAYRLAGHCLQAMDSSHPPKD